MSRRQRASGDPRCHAAIHSHTRRSAGQGPSPEKSTGAWRFLEISAIRSAIKCVKLKEIAGERIKRERQISVQYGTGKRIFILSGARGAGKSSLILRLSEELATAPDPRPSLLLGGYFTLHCEDAAGRLRGFALRSADSLAGRARLSPGEAFRAEDWSEADCFLFFVDSAPRFLLEKFRQQSKAFLEQGLQQAQRQGRQALLLLDEVGGPELLDDAFFFYLVDLCQKNIPILLVLKTSEALDGMLRRLAPGASISAGSSPVPPLLLERRRWLAGQGQRFFLEGTEESRVQVYAALRSWLREQQTEEACPHPRR